jgi:gliding motility-associated-like protein
MKTIRVLALICIIALYTSCKKSSKDTSVVHINCDGLVTDTTGTNDNGIVYMPTAFTPNADGLNDFIRPICYNISSITFTIYDENNAVVFSTDQINHGWGSTIGSNSSVKYYYKIQAATSHNHHIGECGELYKLSCLPGDVPAASLHFEDQLTQYGFTGVTQDILTACH